MNSKALKTLEYNKIINLLIGYAQSSLGKEICAKLVPYNTCEEVISKQKETTEALSLLFKKGSIPINNFKDLTPSLRRLEIGSVLGMGELLAISDVLEICSRVKTYSKLDNIDDNYPIIYQHFNNLETLRPLYQKIRQCIISEEEMSDEASTTLHSIRKEITRTNERIRQQLNQMINSSSVRSMLQENVITMRNDRFCLPVKQEYRSQFQGLIHDQSSTGSTLFIEPIAVVKLNNELKECFAKEQEEIERILYELSSETSEYKDIIYTNMQTLTLLDFIFAKASLSKNLNCSEPNFNTDGYINIKKGRHPLLDPKIVVPIDVYLGNNFTMLMITGPNTGGKTVTLKTVGLLTLMGQSGLHIPAFDGSSLAFFNEVYADIGDEQSIEQNLSTFSSHMTNIIDILNNSNNESLVLFDELGAGTDPTEGAALAMSILKNLHKQQIRTVATTHYSELKVFALSTDGVENASCEFDINSLCPTYRLLIGIPGKSNAFAISKRLGLPTYIINEAKQLITQQDQQFEDLISDLETSKKAIESKKEKSEILLKELKEKEENLNLKLEKLDNRKEKLIQEAKEQAYKIIQEAKNQADESIRNFNQWSKQIKNDHTSIMEKERYKLRKQMNKLESDMISDLKSKKEINSQPKSIKKGDTVFVSTFNQNGTVINKPNNKGEVLVQMGIIKTNVHMSNLSLVDEPIVKNTKLSKTSSGKVHINKSSSIRPEIDLRGLTVEEAIAKLDKYLDDVYLAHLSQITIIHGKGTGALRSSIHKHLKSIKYVKTYRLGNFGEGESGVTIVEFTQ